VKQVIAIVAVGCALVASISEASDYGTLTATYVGQGAGHSLGNGGRFDWRPVTTTPADPGFDLQLNAGTLYTFCIELSQKVATTTFEMNDLIHAPVPGSFMSASQAADVELLADNYWSLATTSGTAVQAGAFQLALWEIIYGNYDAGSGSPITGAGGTPSNAYYTTAGVVAQANVWLQQLLNHELVDNPLLKTIALVNDGKQDQITQVRVAAVPETSSILAWAMFSGMLGGVLMYRRSCIA
jgi:hypothetical protein